MSNCKKCGARFTTKASLSSHMGWHTKEEAKDAMVSSYKSKLTAPAETKPETKVLRRLVIKTPSNLYITNIPQFPTSDIQEAKVFNCSSHLLNWMRLHGSKIPTNCTIRKVFVEYQYTQVVREL